MARKKKNKNSLFQQAQQWLAHSIINTIVFGLYGLAALTLLSILTYTASDPSLNTVVSNPNFDNWGGKVGAYWSDFLIQTMGLAGLALIPLFIGWGYQLHHRQNTTPFLLRFIACLAGLLALSTLLATLPNQGEWIHHSNFGGAAGTMLLNALNNALHYISNQYYTSIARLIAAIVTVVGLGYAAAWRQEQYIFALKYTGYLMVKSLIMAKLFIQSTAYWLKLNSEKPQANEIIVKPVIKKAPVLQETAERPATAQRAAPIVAAPTKPAAPAVKKSQLFTTAQGDEDWILPSSDILQEAPVSDEEEIDERALQNNATMLQQILEDFKVEGEIVKVHPGPVVTLYELEPAPGIKSSRVIGLSDDIARSMSAVSVRAAVVPGQSVIGIELPNQIRKTVYMREVLESTEFEKNKATLPLILGKDIGGKEVIADLARMPHLLIAGTTGSGKSVGINTMLLSLLYRLSPAQCRLIMIDPKMLELSVYDGIPHLLAPVVTEPGKAIMALKWLVGEMENRYRAMSKLGVRNIEGYNQRMKEALKKGDMLTRKVQTGFDPETGKPVFEDQPLDMRELPFIVVVVDEFADLMVTAGKEVENAIQRLAQMARAAGIHIIMATQRPSVDVITGVIKANFPTRISFAVTSKIDSRTILGDGGAETLLGMGDMLYMSAGGRIKRVHGPFVSDDEVEAVVKHLKEQGEPDYINMITDDGMFGEGGEFGEGGGSDVDELYDQAVAIIAREGKASTSFIQRHLQIGYNRAARIIEEMERQGVVSKATATGKRDILISDHSGSDRDVGT
ncbi:MAG: cell division protein FtsK [Micavibrio sp.]|nr:cell division protein FtsK [Micavibrio sp.]